MRLWISLLTTTPFLPTPLQRVPKLSPLHLPNTYCSRRFLQQPFGLALGRLLSSSTSSGGKDQQQHQQLHSINNSQKFSMGRGEYYKNKYGGGRSSRGGGGGRGGGRGGPTQPVSATHSPRGGGTFSDLRFILQRIDGKQYPSYHDLETPMGRGWVNSESGFTLYVGRAQSDPFAPPTRCRVVVKGHIACIPASFYSNKIRTVATCDYLLRTLHENCRRMGADASMSGNGWSGPKGGDIQVMEPCQHVLEQSAVTIDRQTGDVIAQVTINLPARGRTVLGQAAVEIFDRILATLVRQSLFYSSVDSVHLKAHVDSVEDQQWLQSQLDHRGLVAFVRNGAILPRASGVEDTPMESSAIPFHSPKGMEVSFDLPNLQTSISGMGIPEGVTLICGGGFHGKSTLLQALQLGVYPKIPGDGRDFCVTCPNAMKIRAEDGRCVKNVDISPFINNLPFGKNTTNFSTPDASGSTSQASNIAESIEAGADALLIDEDTAATNFMIRDSKMMQLVAAEKEPITPFVRLVRALFKEIGMSTILVIGGSGDFFDVADHVLVMDCYKCHDVTKRAKQIASQSTASTATPYDGQQHAYVSGVFQKLRSGGQRYPVGNAYDTEGKVKVNSKAVISYGTTELNLAGLEQLVSKSQTNAISASLQRVASLASDGGVSIEQILSKLEQSLERDGFDALSPGQLNGGLARPRRLEIAGAINRLRRPGSIVQR